MVIRRIELTDFRIYKNAVIELDPGVTAVMGLNAQGKTSLAEAMSYLSTLQSFRGVGKFVFFGHLAMTSHNTSNKVD